MSLSIRSQQSFSKIFSNTQEILPECLLELKETALDLLNAHLLMALNAMNMGYKRMAWSQTKLAIWANGYVRRTAGRHQSSLVEKNIISIRSGKRQWCTNVYYLNPSFFKIEFLKKIAQILPAANMLLQKIVSLYLGRRLIKKVLVSNSLRCHRREGDTRAMTPLPETCNTFSQETRENPLQKDGRTMSVQEPARSWFKSLDSQKVDEQRSVPSGEGERPSHQPKTYIRPSGRPLGGLTFLTGECDYRMTDTMDVLSNLSFLMGESDE